MPPLSVFMILAISVFVGEVFPASQKEGLNATSPESTTIAKNVSTAVTTNTTEVPSLAIKVNNKNETNQVEKTAKLNATEKSTVAERLSVENGITATPTTKAAAKEGKDCHLKKEQDDMVKCSVTPRDDDDTIEHGADSNVAVVLLQESTTTVRHEDGVLSSTQTTPKFIPHDGTDVHLNETETDMAKLNQTSYKTVSPEVDVPVNVVTAGTIQDVSTNSTEVSISPVKPLVGDNLQSRESQGSNGVGKHSGEDEKSMPSGVIALVTAITFAIAAVIGYVSIIAWRRYLEYRYGHRELLVNDLEFDTNDLRHFEL